MYFGRISRWKIVQAIEELTQNLVRHENEKHSEQHRRDTAIWYILRNRRLI